MAPTFGVVAEVRLDTTLPPKVAAKTLRGDACWVPMRSDAPDRAPRTTGGVFPKFATAATRAAAVTAVLDGVYEATSAITGRIQRGWGTRLTPL